MATGFKNDALGLLGGQRSLPCAGDCLPVEQSAHREGKASHIGERTVMSDVLPVTTLIALVKEKMTTSQNIWKPAMRLSYDALPASSRIST
jgi:hypothetical protein